MQTKSSSPPWNKPRHKRLVLFKSKTSTDTKTPPKEKKERSIPQTKTTTTTTINYNQWMYNRSIDRAIEQASEGFSLLHTKHLRMIPLANSICANSFERVQRQLTSLYFFSQEQSSGDVWTGTTIPLPTDRQGKQVWKGKKRGWNFCLLGERNSDFS
jgi:hypothetical protein